MLSRVFKDIYPRYQTMRGHMVERKGGWDCHGLPVEIAVEQQLGITTKAEIEERIGIERFNAECRESVFAYLQEWNRLTERIGFWIDLDDAYRTLDETYIESVWWALAEIDRRGLLYEGHKVVPYCYRCGTALSSHEVALGYQDVVDPSVWVQLTVIGDHLRVKDGDRLLIWTTTPWTLPGNVAVAVAPDIEYVRARYDGQTLILAAALVERVLGEGAEIMDRFPGSELVRGVLPGSDICVERSRAGRAIRSSRATSSRPRTALGSCTSRRRLARTTSAWRRRTRVSFDPTCHDSLYNPVRPDGTFDKRVRSYEGREYDGRVVKDPDVTDDLIDDLDKRGLLLQARSATSTRIRTAGGVKRR